jgi:hypothetical protein
MKRGFLHIAFEEKACILFSIPFMSMTLCPFFIFTTSCFLLVYDRRCM